MSKSLELVLQIAVFVQNFIYSPSTFLIAVLLGIISVVRDKGKNVNKYERWDRIRAQKRRIWIHKRR